MELKTKKGDSFLIDDEDYHLIENMNYYKNVYGYIQCYCKISKQVLLMHRVIMRVSDSNKPMVDHINRDKKDNRKCNLRFCTNSENQKNKKPKGKSKYLGVTCQSTNKNYIKEDGLVSCNHKIAFLARIIVNGKQKHLGSFTDEIDAAIAYNDAAKIYHGEFANLNKISTKFNIKIITEKEATLKVQGLKGSIPFCQLAEKIGISKPTLYTRLVKSNWRKCEIQLIENL